MLPRSPYPLDGIKLARDTLADHRMMGEASPEARRELVRRSLVILQKDRIARLGLTDPPDQTGRVIHIPRAIFQAGRTILPPRRRPRLVVLPASPTPGDAA